MTAEKLYTERDMVLAKREAFEAGARWRSVLAFGWELAPMEAAKRYPLPKVTRPRVVVDDGGIDWQFIDGSLQWRSPDGIWRRTQDYQLMAIGEERIRLWADLLANPTEEVEDDA